MRNRLLNVMTGLIITGVIVGTWAIGVALSLGFIYAAVKVIQYTLTQ